MKATKYFKGTALRRSIQSGCFALVIQAILDFFSNRLPLIAVNIFMIKYVFFEVRMYCVAVPVFIISIWDYYYAIRSAS